MRACVAREVCMHVLHCYTKEEGHACIALHVYKYSYAHELHVCTFGSIHVCTNSYVHALYVCMRVRMHVCTYSYVQCHAGMPLRNIHCIACLSVFICPCLCVGMLLCFCVQMSECMYTQMQWAHSLIIRTRCIYKCTGSMCV